MGISIGSRAYVGSFRLAHYAVKLATAGDTVSQLQMCRKSRTHSLLQPLYRVHAKAARSECYSPSKPRESRKDPGLLVIIPAHHIGLRRYSVLSTGPLRSFPLVLARFAASLRPFFVIMKLVPMATEDAMASPRPIHLFDCSIQYCYSSLANACCCWEFALLVLPAEGDVYIDGLAF